MAAKIVRAVRVWDVTPGGVRLRSCRFCEKAGRMHTGIRRDSRRIPAVHDDPVDAFGYALAMDAARLLDG